MSLTPVFARVQFSIAASVPTINRSANILAITYISSGFLQIIFQTRAGHTHYGVFGNGIDASNLISFFSPYWSSSAVYGTDSFYVFFHRTDGSGTDPSDAYVFVLGA